MSTEENTIHILIVEDESGHAELIHRALMATPGKYDVTVTSTIKEAQDIIVHQKPNIALVDYRLPDGQGDTIIELGKNSFPVVMLTSHGDEQLAVQAIKSGALDYVAKSPETFDSLPNVVDRALREWKLIEDRKKAEDALRETNAYLENLINFANAPIIVWDPHFHITRFNHAFEFLTGLKEADVLGKSLEILFPPEHCAQSMELIRKTLTGERWETVEIEILHHDKSTRTVLWNSATLFTEDDKRPIATIAQGQDITERKQAEEALRQAQKLESIGTLAGGIAHDFNNLLVAILGQSSLALKKIPNESSARSNITKVIKASERAAELTRQILAYSGRGKFFVEEIDLNLLVTENIQMLEVSIPKTTQMQYDLDSTSPRILGDIGQIQQVIMNLIINAGEAMGLNPGYITLRTSKIEITHKNTDYWKYTNTPLEPGNYALLQISDSGHGMKPEVLSRIFDPFFTTKFTGRGLGLAAALGIIRGHKGGLRIESEDGKGTKFEIVLPLIESSSKSETQEKEEKLVINGEGKIILAIDDESSVIELLEDILTEVKFKVLGSLYPLEGIELYRKYQNNIAMVVLDYSMPSMDGKTAFEELLKINKDVKVLLCSGYTEEETFSTFGTLRPSGFFQKPYTPQALLDRVSSILSDTNAVNESSYTN